MLRKYNTNDIDPDKAEAGKLTPYYKGQFIANKASGIKTLADLKGKTFCFVDPNSTSGSIIPRIILKANGIDPEKDLKAVQNAGSHDNVGIAVYKGDCDAGVTYIDVLTDAAANLKGKYPGHPRQGGLHRSDRPDPQRRRPVRQGPRSQDPGSDHGRPAGDGGRPRRQSDVCACCTPSTASRRSMPTFYKPFAEVLKKAGVDPATLVK